MSGGGSKIKFQSRPSNMFLVLVYPNGKCVDDRVWKLDEAKAAMRALVECGRGVHLAVITMRSDVDESFVSTI